MGIFNTQSFGQPFGRGAQGAPGVGFSLTADGNYDMVNKKLTNVGTPTSNADAATKKNMLMKILVVEHLVVSELIQTLT